MILKRRINQVGRRNVWGCNVWLQKLHQVGVQKKSLNLQSFHTLCGDGQTFSILKERKINRLPFSESSSSRSLRESLRIPGNPQDLCRGGELFERITQGELGGEAQVRKSVSTTRKLSAGGWFLMWWKKWTHRIYRNTNKISIGNSVEITNTPVVKVENSQLPC